VQRTGVRHKDEWILYNIRKLQWELYPAAYGRDRNFLLAKASQLERSLYQAQPLSGLSLDALQKRQAAVTDELNRLESRQRGLSGKASPQAGLDRLAEIAQAAGQGGDEALKTEAEGASRDAAALRSSAPKLDKMPQDEFDQRRQEILTLLDALGTTNPNRKRSVEDLRRRLLALSPGDTAAESLKRAIDQRKLDLDRIRDEIALRSSSEPLEARTLPEQLALRQDLKSVQDTLSKYYSFGGLSPALSAADRARKLESLAKLSGAGKGEHCAKCHVLNEGSLLPQRAAQRVMVRATFNHLPHLDAPLPQPSLVARVVGIFKREAGKAPLAGQTRCALCHETITKAGDAPRKPAIPQITSCQTCHRSGATRADCMLCHRFHPPGVAS
jgi:hypothetical protein